MTILTEEDFENAEEAMNALERQYEQNPSMLYALTRREIVIHEFAKKVLAEARRDFLTEENPPSPLEARVKNLEASAENMRDAFERLCKILAWKVSPSTFSAESCDVMKIARGEK